VLAQDSVIHLLSLLLLILNETGSTELQMRLACLLALPFWPDFLDREYWPEQAVHKVEFEKSILVLLLTSVYYGGQLLTFPSQ